MSLVGQFNLFHISRTLPVLYIGISDAPAWIVSMCNVLAELRGWTPFIGLQIEYSLIQRTPERDLLPMAHTLDIGVTAWSPLASGWLTGKYSNGKGNEAQESRRLDNEAMSAFVQQNERNSAIARTVDRLAQQIGCSSAQVALNWLRQQGVIPIIGARKLSQVQNNLDCLNFELSPEHMNVLHQVSQIELGFPHDFLQQEMPRQFIYGGMFDSIDNHQFSQVG